MTREVLIYNGDGLRALETNEMVGRPVNLNGRRGYVVENDALTITVEWDKKSKIPWYVRTWRRLAGNVLQVGE